jgi:hypothetical protein
MNKLLLILLCLPLSAFASGPHEKPPTVKVEYRDTTCKSCIKRDAFLAGVVVGVGGSYIVWKTDAVEKVQKLFVKPTADGAKLVYQVEF